MANNKQQQQVPANGSNISTRPENQQSSPNAGNNFLNQSTVDLASLLEIPLFNELMLVYEIQYNATKDALKHFLEEQPSLILPLFTNVVWSLLVNPLLAINPAANSNLPAQDLPTTNSDLQRIAEEILDKTKSINNNVQNVNSVQNNETEHSQVNNNPEKRTRRIYRAENQKNNSILCNVCAKPLKNRAAFVKHRRRHLGISELAFACGTCDKRCSERRHLAVHCRNKHHEMPSVPSKPVLRSNPEQEMMILNDSNGESSNLFPELNSMNDKAYYFLIVRSDSKIPVIYVSDNINSRKFYRKYSRI